jgi:tRNA-2-methylthio-N6-dimethylallyladenosine synthase
MALLYYKGRPFLNAIILVRIADIIAGVKYHIWTEGCQMNSADSLRVSAALEGLGYQECRQVEDADVIVLNTCVVRQSAEDKAVGRLSSLKKLKQQKPGLLINLMGCLVGVGGTRHCRSAFRMATFSPAPPIHTH